MTRLLGATVRPALPRYCGPAHLYGCALDVLDTVAVCGVATAHEIADDTGRQLCTVHRAVAALRRRGLVEVVGRALRRSIFGPPPTRHRVTALGVAVLRSRGLL